MSERDDFRERLTERVEAGRGEVEALRKRVSKLEEANRALDDALDRAVGNMTLAVRGLPVRDMAETIAEALRAKKLAEDALSPNQQEGA